ncbi:UNVERIFIED_CONTAM: hypothetical protein Sradi_4886800 [Sesamum radiatum]|uniref:DUF4283 domain-containing protein n=1 Tax=Sesamum radiatum TaxID=300843 RepID=A0AAW2MEQ7_SESRA
MVSFCFNSDEFTPLTRAINPNSAESTRSAPTQQSTSKSFCDAIAEKRNPPHHTAELKNFYLANANSPQIGTIDYINGRPTVRFSDSETQALAVGFHLTLIGKFSKGSPPYSQLHLLLSDLGIKGKFTESSIVPVWVSLPELPAHLFRKDVLFVIAKIIGTPLQIDHSTANQSKFLKARVCVEIDLLKPMPQEVDLQICGETIVQKIEYEQVLTYCSLCHHVGYQDSACYSKGNAPKPPSRKRVEGRKFVVAKQQQLQKGKEVVQVDHQVFEEMTDRNTPTTEKGECSKMTDIQKSCAENVDLVAVNDGFYAENDVCDVENDSIRVREVETDGNGNVGCGNTSVMEVDVNWQEDNVIAENYSLDCENIGFICGIEEKNVNKNEENAINLRKKLVGTMITRQNNIVGDLRRGMKWISVDIAVRLIQNWKRFGVVIKGIKEDVEAVIKRNKLAVSSAIQFQKCVLLYDPVRQLNLKPLDTGEQFDQGVLSPKKPSPIASRTRCRKKGKKVLAVHRKERKAGKKR